MDTKDEDGNTVRFGSVGGGGRYDDLVARFTGAQVPATGFSIGVSRLYSALKLVGKAKSSDTLAPVVVLVMDKDRQRDYYAMVQKLAQRWHSRRNVHGHRWHEGSDEICRQTRCTARRHPRWRRKSGRAGDRSRICAWGRNSPQALKRERNMRRNVWHKSQWLEANLVAEVKKMLTEMTCDLPTPGPSPRIGEG